MKRLLFLLSGILLVISCTKSYQMPPSPGRVIKSYKLETGQYGNETISMEGGVYKITVLVLKKTDLSSLKPNIVISQGATILPASGEKIDASVTKNHAYTVTAASGEKMKWQVEFKVVDNSVSDYGAFTISSVSGGKFLEPAGDITSNKKYLDNALIVLNTPSVSENKVNRWQEWQFIYQSTVDDIKYYHIRSLHSGKLLTVPEGAATSGLQLQQSYDLSAKASAQLWKIEETAIPGTCKIINKGNGLALTNADASSSNPKVVQETTANADNQKWVLNSIAADSYRDDEVVRFFNRNLPSQGSVAFDQGTSIPLANGKVLWITQDAWDGTSLLSNHMFNCSAFFNYGNSVLIQPSTTNWDNTATTNMTTKTSSENRPKQIFNKQGSDTFAWPGLGVEIDNKVYIQCGEGSGLEAKNQSLYVLTQISGDEWAALRTTPAGMSGQVNINYSTGMVKAADGYVYSFGSQATGFGYSNNIHVARFPANNPQSWTFWDGANWNSTPVTGTAARIAEGLGNNTISYVNGKYIFLTMDQGFNCDAARNVYISTATSPTGPYTTRKLVYTINEYINGQYARYYTPAIHPEFNNGHDELLITYCLNYSACGGNACQDGFMDPYFYRVKGVRVPYSLFGL
jgi:hypothetical protein